MTVMIKGKNQHVMPDADGWCVVDEANQMIIQHFDSFEEAVAYARHCAAIDEGDVLIHKTSSTPERLSTVGLPQREFLRSRAYSEPGKGLFGRKKGLGDPFSELDEAYFGI
jgi:hypothetical protein